MKKAAMKIAKIDFERQAVFCQISMVEKPFLFEGRITFSSILLFNF